MRRCFGNQKTQNKSGPVRFRLAWPHDLWRTPQSVRFGAVRLADKNVSCMSCCGPVRSSNAREQRIRHGGSTTKERPTTDTGFRQRVAEAQSSRRKARKSAFRFLGGLRGSAKLCAKNVLGRLLTKALVRAHAVRSGNVRDARTGLSTDCDRSAGHQERRHKLSHKPHHIVLIIVCQYYVVKFRGFGCAEATSFCGMLGTQKKGTQKRGRAHRRVFSKHMRPSRLAFSGRWRWLPIADRAIANRAARR
jgi:hypothetical protein